MLTPPLGRSTGVPRAGGVVPAVSRGPRVHPAGSPGPHYVRRVHLPRGARRDGGHHATRHTALARARRRTGYVSSPGREGELHTIYKGEGAEATRV